MDKEMLDINEVIIRYLDGTATQPEKDRLLDWLKQSEQNRRDFSQIRDLWMLSNAVPSGRKDKETEAALGRWRQRVGIRRRITFRPATWQMMKVAAVVVLVFAVGYLSYSWGERSTAAGTTVVNRLLTAEGSKGRFVLPDSTVVWLNANTRLDYPAHFTAEAREVHLEGQAYFEVKKDESKPFKVYAGVMEVEVLGTHFTVENYPHKADIEAVLAEGSVKITGCGMNHAVVLTPGQLMSYDKKNGRRNVQTVNAGNYTSWIGDKMVFDNTPLADIVVNLEQWFVTEIECDPAFAQTVSMSFSVQNGDNLDDILASMALVSPISYHRENRVVHILPKK